MRIFESECVNCGLPCLYSACPYYNVEKFICDICKEEAKLRNTEFGEVCESCLVEQFPIVEGSEY